MKTTRKWSKMLLVGMAAMVLAFGLVVTGCGDPSGGPTGTGNNNGTSTGETGSEPPPALRAVGVATEPNSPSGVKVVDSYTDGTYNYYWLDVGIIYNTYISTILSGYFDGFNPVTVTKVTATEKTISNSITNTTASTITFSDTQNHTVGIAAAWKNKASADVGFVSGSKEFSVNLNYEWTGSWTNSTTNTKTIETLTSEIISTAESNTTSIKFGEKGGPTGNYRYALYGISKVYFFISTSLDNSELLSWDTVVLAYDSQPHTDYSPDGIFDNSPESGKTINLPENFWKKLPKPPTESSKIVGIPLPLDVWGGKQFYQYTVLSAGNLSYTLTGGGAGGAGAAAARDYDEPWDILDTDSTTADAGWSGGGGPTILKLNGIEIARADGGAKVDGPSRKADGNSGASPGVKGRDGQTKTGVQTVFAGDTITIEVGYGGGGSGGAAANDTKGTTSSGSVGSADKTLGSDEKYAQKSGTVANASRGGVGAMHSLFYPSSGYTSDLQKGASSSAASDAAAAQGGQTKGEGGSAGNGQAAGGMYASGGGGGAAGGFILNSPNVLVGIE